MHTHTHTLHTNTHTTHTLNIHAHTLHIHYTKLFKKLKKLTAQLLLPSDNTGMLGTTQTLELSAANPPGASQEDCPGLTDRGHRTKSSTMTSHCLTRDGQLSCINRDLVLTREAAHPAVTSMRTC